MLAQEVERVLRFHLDNKLRAALTGLKDLLSPKGVSQIEGVGSPSPKEGSFHGRSLSKK